MGAPDAQVYAGHSADIVDTLQDLLDKALAQLADARKTEVEAVHNFDMLKMSLNDQTKSDNKELDDTKADLAACGEKILASKGSLKATAADLDSAVNSLNDLKADCAAKAKDFEIGQSSRANE